MKLYIILSIILLIPSNFSRLGAQANSGAYPGPVEIAGRAGVINDTRVRLRTRPDLKSEVLTFFNFGDKVKVIRVSAEKQNIDGVESYWCKVRSDNNPDGWVFGAYVDILEKKPDSDASINDSGSQNIWTLPDYKDNQEAYEDGEITAGLEAKHMRESEELRKKRWAWLLWNIGSDFDLSREEMTERYGDSYDLEVHAVGRSVEVKNDYIAYSYTYRKENINFNFLDNKYYGRVYLTDWTIYPGFTLSGFVLPKTKSEWYKYFGKEAYLSEGYKGFNWMTYHFLKSAYESFIFQVYLDDDLETILRVSCERAE
jgi:hypothetical protein